ncbi:unnamed protein product [Bursaphelenchus xylophilus]|uniref:(pine wood nematode) hypothetical protein n=1 Tax=Bursaphelenchus xylophilus TaxID=6326 RepID=A0A1I7RL35_BURXY|nr:unnamed protein product [Bursaphelenchus xylophilus]CAG9083512.1 unnamed protein product [Bursaphelenchus xylophilus]
MPRQSSEKIEPSDVQISEPPNQKIVVVETTSCRQVQLCNGCAHNVAQLQHDNAVFALKSECDKDFDIPDNSSFRPPSKRGIPISNSTRAIAKRAKLDVNSLRGKNLLGSDLQNYSTEAQFTDDNRKVIFPESEYDILEKRLIALESELQHSGGNEDPEFKRLCKMGVIYEEKWARLYCRDYHKPINEYRNEAIGVLKQNLNIRRDGLRPFMRLMQARQHPYTTEVTTRSKRDVLAVSPAVNIVAGRMTTPKEYSKGNVKKTFGHCVPITTLMTGPYYNYSYVQNDHCYMIENELFDVESRLKRCAPGTKEYKRLVEEGKRLRYEWKQTYEEVRRTRAVSQPVAAYDLKKCVVVNRGGKRIAVPVTDEEISQQLMEGDIDVEVQD